MSDSEFLPKNSYPVAHKAEVALRLVAALLEAVPRKSLTPKQISEYFNSIYATLSSDLDDSGYCNCEECAGDTSEVADVSCNCTECLCKMGMPDKLLEDCLVGGKDEEEYVSLMVSFPRSVYSELQKLVMISKTGNICSIRPDDVTGVWKWDAGSL